MEWSVELVGHKFDLEELPKWLDGGDFSVVQEDDDYFLRSEYLDRFEEPQEVRRAAEEVVDLINGLGRIQWQEFQPISIGVIETRDEGGGRKVYISGSDTVRMRDKAVATVTDKNGTVRPPKDVGRLNPWIEVATRDVKVQQALGYLNRPEITWSDLYRAFEVVEDDVGAITKAGWASRKQLSRFTGTANSYAVLGYAARHANDTKPPSNPIEFAQARALVLHLVQKWMDSKIED